MTRWQAISITLLVLTSGCQENDPAPAPPPQQKTPPIAKPTQPTPQPVAVPVVSDHTTSEAVDSVAGGADYQIYCSTCHGPKGDGDGPLAASLDPKPARHSDSAYMNSLTDDYLFGVIKFGGASVGKSPLMAPMEGMLSDPQIRNVIAFVRSLAAPAP
jgi:mono/diheme cytochrome c family protein